MLIYAQVNYAFSGFAGLKLVLVIQLLRKKKGVSNKFMDTPFLKISDLTITSR